MLCTLGYGEPTGSLMHQTAPCASCSESNRLYQVRRRCWVGSSSAVQYCTSYLFSLPWPVWLSVILSWLSKLTVAVELDTPLYMSLNFFSSLLFFFFWFRSLTYRCACSMLVYRFNSLAIYYLIQIIFVRLIMFNGVGRCSLSIFNLRRRFEIIECISSTC